MTIEERIKALEEQSDSAHRDIKQLLLDIDIFLVVALTPLKDKSDARSDKAAPKTRILSG